MQNSRAYVAELLGAFFLTLVVRLSLGATFPLATPLLAGITLGLFVYTVGSISGSHLNPAVTIGLAIIKKISPADAVMYIVSQIVGATLAGIIGTWLLGRSMSVVAGDTMIVAVTEAIGAAVLLFGIASVVYKKTPDAASGLVVGSSLTLGVIIASVGSAGILNPAVALGIGSLSFSYLLGPIVGACIATVGYRWIKG